MPRLFTPNDLSFVISDLRDAYFVKKYFRTIFIVTATKLKYILPCSVNVRSHKYPKIGLRIWHLNAVFYSQAC